MKIKLIAAVGETIEAFVDAVGLRNFMCGVIFIGLMVAMFLPTMIKAMQ